ncbi:sarcoplasmic calcium-binding protein [Phymastichus coffea]|uniref:sarcoplasmic calcium-binding protein n=1 Tax=Phymastichus coffea TaxID=108790 RepID=UPI00273B83ED|nr:sarcoplasmic calcium-binding protein [Phymastichus coffea]
MATVLMRMGLRQAFLGKNLMERKLVPAVCSGFLENDAAISQDAIHVFAPKVRQYNAMRQMSSGTRKVHHAQASKAAALDEEKSDHESDSGSGSDSDDDGPRNRESARARSHFWRRKMRTLHSHLDVNKDGWLSYDDFKLLGERFAKLGHLTVQQKEEFQAVLRQMWEEQWGAIDKYNLIDVEKYLTEMHHVLEDKSLRKKVHSFLPFLFKAVDKDNSGEISVEEFKLFFKCLGMENDDAVVTFTYIDINEDGKLSMKEFVKLGRDFFLTDDQTKPSKHFWGPLVD